MRSRFRRWALCAAVLASCTRSAPPTATSNDHRAAAGAVDPRGSVTLALEARMARWHPAADDGPALEVATFGEVGRTPMVPGPMIRVPVGTNVSVSLTNRLTDTLLVTGLIDPRTDDTLVVAPGATASAAFRADQPGLYGYVGATRYGGPLARHGRGDQLSGVIAVDSVGAPADRIFAISAWNGPSLPGTTDSAFLLAVNGRMWPHTERLRMAVGDSVHWRVINLAESLHPMHLHGAYFRVDSRGTWRGDTAYQPADRRLVVTETMRLRETMSLTWSPERPGNWLFHCHDAFHVTGDQTARLDVGAPLWAAQLAGRAPPTAPPPAAHDTGAAMVHGMAGLVLGIEVSGPAAAESPVARKRVDLMVQQQPGRYGADPGIGFVLARPGVVPEDSVVIPGPPLILERGVPTAITVHNRLKEPTSIHWHGLEIESYFDGVAGWSGTAAKLAPSIAPGDSFVARFTPPRAGTFIYHSHFGEVRQLSLGLFGALVVLEPGQRWNADRDRLVIFSVDGLGDSALVVAHHATAPLRAGTRYRMRFINITSADNVTAELVQNGVVIPWRIVAKDGADLARPRNGPAQIDFGPGETLDVEVSPGRGPITLRVRSYNNFESVMPVR